MYLDLFEIGQRLVPTAATLQIAIEGMPLVVKVGEALTQSIINQGSDAAYHMRIDYLNSMVTICWEKH